MIVPPRRAEGDPERTRECQQTLIHPRRYIVSKYCGLAEFTGFETISDSEVPGVAQQAVSGLIDKIIHIRSEKKGR